MSEELRSDPVAAPKQGWYARYNAWYRENKVLNFACMMVFFTASTLFFSGTYDQLIHATLVTALLFGAGSALVIITAAAMIWAILAERNRLVPIAALAVAASSSILFLVFSTPTPVYFSDSGKFVVVLRLVIAAPALVAAIALLIQALPKRRWGLAIISIAVVLLASATLYLAFEQNQSWINGDNAVVYGEKAAQYTQAKQYDAAIAVYSEAIRLQPYTIFYYDDQASAYKAKGDYDSAITVYNTYINLESSNIPNNYLIGSTYGDIASAYSTTLRYNQAIQAYSSALQYSPSGADVYESRADLYLKLGQKDKAIADYQAELAHDGVTTSLSNDSSTTFYLNPADRDRIEQKLKNLGISPSAATASPTP